ncbi:peptidase family C50-domain-containing protein [Dichomitus squalens]|uniref:separase n=1 Tax=Dichomitus squalens TaxID=114155 RepID=A0A4Q9PS46_9APHY|nr:peptidase family C50-domain-containing protein [Dichomitus squalens]
MRAVNAASKSLSTLLDSGWRMSQSDTSDRPTTASATKTATSARKDLTTLRNLCPGQVDIERAASSIIAKLITLEMYHAALGLLQDMRQPLIALYHPAPPPPSAPSPLDLLTLPIFDPPISELHISLVSTYLIQILQVLSNTTTDIPALVAALYNPATPTLLAWTTIMSTLPEKQYDQFFARAYSITSRLASTPIPASSAYSLRIYSLLCLAHTRPSVVSPNTFWEQAVKFTAMFANTDSVSPEGAAQSVSDSCARLVAAVEKRQDFADFMAGVAFARFCEYWSRFAKQAGDLRALEQVGRLVRYGNHESQAEEDRTVIEASALATSLARALAVFEQSTEHGPDFTSKISEFTVDIKGCGPSLAQSGGDHDRVKRGLERLRRAAVKVVEPSQELKTSFTHEVKSSARAVLEQIVDVHCEAITQRNTFSSSTLTPALETLFTLARISFVVNNPDTYTVAHSHLARAAALLSDPPASSSVSKLALAGYTRCVAGVYHYLAGQLHQSGRYDHTVRLAEEGCRLGQRALQMYHAAKNDASTDVDGESKGKEEAWKLLEEQLYRRWELLAVCHAKTGDRKSAYEAFLNSISAFPFTQHKLAELARTTPSTALFEASPALKQLGALVDRVTYIASCELFKGSEAVSASSWFAVGSSTLSKDDTDCVLGAILERQISSLEESKWKQGVQSVLRRLIEDALEVYTAEQRPVRRARVLLKRLELSYHSGLTSTEQNEDATQYHEEAKSLLSRQDFALDGALAQYSSEFSASLHLWLAVHAHRTRDPALSPSVISHTEEACKIIRAMVPAPVPRYSVGPRPSLLGSTSKAPRNKIVEPAPAESQLPQRMTRGKAAATGRTKAAPRATKAKAPPVTPRRRRALDPVSLNAAVVTPPKATATAGVQVKVDFDDFSKFIGLIRMVSHLIGLVGHILVRVQLLNAARRLSERHTGVASEVYVSLTIDIAHEYVKLGRAEKAASILAHVLPAVRSGSLSPDVVVVLLLRYSEALAASGEVLKASMTYCDAVATAADCVVEEKGLPTAQRVRVRAALLERAAQAALSYAAIQDARDDPTSSIEGLMQALRLWNRAIDTLSRLQPSTPTKQPAEENPFEVTSKQPEDSGPSSQETRILSPRASKAHVFVDSCGWRLAEGLLSTLLSLSQAYAARGSAREAEFFVQQTKDLAESLHAPVMISRALAQHGELQIQLGQLQEGHQSLMRAAELVMHLKGPDAAEIRRLQGRYNQLSADSKGARQLFEEATTLLDELGSMFSALDGANWARTSLIVSPRSLNAQLSDSVLAPTLLARVLRHQISLLHEVGEEYTQLLEKFAKLPHNAETKSEEIALRAKLTLDEVYSRFRADMFLSSLAESGGIAMTIPMGMSGDIPPSSASQDMLETLTTAEKLFWDHLTYVARRGHVSSVREAAVCLALIRTFRTSLGRGDKYTPILAAQLLDASTVTTLRREMVEVIRHKFLELNATDDLQWPLITPNGSPLPPSVKPRRVAQFSHPKFPEENDDDEESLDDVDLKSYWDSIAKRYGEQCFDSQRLSISQVDALPANWTVVNVSVTEDRHTMFVARQRTGQKPLIFCLPLKGRRDGQEDEHLTFEDAIGELQEIIRLSDEGARQAGDVKKDDKAARVAWWKSRTALDTRLKELLTDIEFCWLGAFKTIFNASRDVHPDDLAVLRSRLDTIFMGSLVFQDKKPKSRIGLDDGLLECFSRLPPTCRDEELEDLIYFILDLYQFHGIPIAISEVDMDQIVVELRNALEEHSVRLKARSIDVDEDGHIFLVLDKNVQGIPWESLPVLRGKSTSRIPSVDFLLDRLEFSRLHKQRAQATSLDRATVDPRKTYFVLNPSGDLKGTEGRFASWLKEMKTAGWDGIIGRPPSEQQFLDALANRDLVIYFGHGGAEQYVRSHKVRHLQRCAATMLWGCSSGTLKYMGDFDRTGTPYHYMLAGCPTLVANLWDVTDRDIDKFSQSVFDDLHLNPDAVKKWCPGGGDRTPMSIVKAVSRARDSCKLRYLTGAAPVIYGIPFYL